MTNQSEYGYVLDGTKPISVMDISSLEALSAPGTPWFALNINALEAVEVWKRLNPRSKDTVLKITEVFEPQSNLPQYEVLFINKLKLQEVIASNIDLFRYVLGPALEPNSFMEQIAESPTSLSTILNNDRALMGIVLGFGTHNSLLHNRIEVLNNVHLYSDVPPFSSNYILMYNNIDELQLRAFS